MTIKFARLAALASMAGAVLVVLANGPAAADHGYLMKKHPLRGDFPSAMEKAEVTPANDAVVTEARPSRQRNEPGGWLRGDFPTAAESQRRSVVLEAVAPEAVTRGLGETWTCSVQQASAQITDAGATQAVMRVIHLQQ